MKKELEWINARAQNRRDEGHKEYDIESERQYARNDILIKYGFTFTDASI